MPKMNILLLLDHLEKLAATNFRLAGKVWMDKDELDELIKKVRIALPDEIKEAEWVSREKERYLAQAQEEAKRILREAESYAERLVREDQITTRAEEDAHRIVNDAKQTAVEIEDEALQYASQLLENLEDSLDRTIKVVHKGREEILNKYKL
ncbi:MAG TPA: ATPase [Firmicutes bacterium]|jgi:vacuolar-type H+-ATPase subunit H|nr:ATPase [Bacillota bacterium]